jgi:hypothetical protein
MGRRVLALPPQMSQRPRPRAGQCVGNGRSVPLSHMWQHGIRYLPAACANSLSGRPNLLRKPMSGTAHFFHGLDRNGRNFASLFSTGMIERFFSALDQFEQPVRLAAESEDSGQVRGFQLLPNCPGAVINRTEACLPRVTLAALG